MNTHQGRNVGTPHTLGTPTAIIPELRWHPELRRPKDGAAPCDFPGPSRSARTQSTLFQPPKCFPRKQEISYHILPNLPPTKGLLRIIHHIDLEVLFFLLQISGKGKYKESDSHLNFGEERTWSLGTQHVSHLGASDT